MKISLATSLHLDHASTRVDVTSGSVPRMQTFVPVGLLSIKATLDRDVAGCSTQVVELNGLVEAGEVPNDAEFYEHLAGHVVRGAPDLVGLMTDADSLHHTVTMARTIKRRRPDVLVCLGGPGSSGLGRELLESFECIDFVVTGEGEETSVELVDALERGRDPSGILGLHSRSSNPARYARRPVLDDLDRLPVPAFDAYDMGSGAPIYVDVGRGCPFKCSFCATAPFWQRRFRMKSIARVVSELELLRGTYGRRHVAFSHDIFTYDRAWTMDFCAAISAAALDITWSCSTRTDRIDDELLRAMADAGCVEIYYGIETGTVAQQRSINKRLDLDWSRGMIRAAVAVGIRPVTGFIVGYPEESSQSLRGTLDLFMEALALGAARAHLFVLCPFHEAPLHGTGPALSERRAEYRDLVLEPRAAVLGERLEAEHPDMFITHRRYETPSIDHRWIDAAEGLSCHLVTLRSLWPLLLPSYTDVVEWYGRWVTWIAAYNAKNRAASPLRHQGDAADVLAFVAAEVERLGLEDEAVGTMLAYERAKLAAGALALPRGRALTAMPAHGKVWLRASFIAESFVHEIGRLLAGADTPRCPPRWVIFTRLDDGGVRTIEVPRRALDVLDDLREPRQLDELHLDPPSGASESRAQGRFIVGRLVEHGLIGGEST